MACAQDSGDADALVRGQLRQRCQRGETNAATKHDDVLPGRLELEAVAQRTRDVEFVAGFQGSHPARPAPFGLVEKLDLTRRLVDAVAAHRPEHPDLAAVR